MGLALGYFDYYLIIINIVGFILFTFNTWLYSHTEDQQIDTILTIVSLLGGTLGIVLSIMAFDRKAVKGNMMSRVFVFCILAIQIVVVLVMKGNIKENITFAFWNFFDKYKILIVYLLIINFATLIAFGIDKINAVTHRSRMRIVTLLGLACAGGSIGAL